MKSPKSKGLTETGPLIKKASGRKTEKNAVPAKDKNHLLSYFPETKKTKYEGQLKSPLKKIKDNKLKKVNFLHKNPRLKTEGSFDSTTSCIFNNDVEIIGLIGQGTFGQVFKGRLKQTG